ncbi:SH3 domain-binding protein 2 isoform X3 [Hypomesus transpacificus]|uniref:SH3 domain-binding protein 2 isoform X3 n=1 Tax=Hypomesus transpacificus TaxID=137520 RepID=UPI001F07FB4E|nr:SH3 domain-binding protein 2 isoform X3 [Hypomesus transpacificus]
MALSLRKKKSIVLATKPSVRICVRKPSHISMAAVEVSWPIPMRAIGAQNLLTMPGGVSSSGYLHKKGGSQFSLMKWPLRYVILHKGCLYYFKSSTSAAPQGAFSLNGYNRVMRAAEETTSSNVFPFKVVHFSKKHRTWLFSAASEDERRKWMRTLRREIDYYNDRTDSFASSDPDSDADSFYGSIEQPLNINPTPHNPEDDYMVEEDEDDEDDDYVKPDDSPTSSGKPTAPPPSYPPPPVPGQNRQDSASSHFKSLPPPVPLPNRTSTSTVLKKPPPPYPPPKHTETPVSKGPPPPLPFAPHLTKACLDRSPPSLSPSPTPPPLPPASLKKPALGRVSNTLPVGGDQRDRVAVSVSLKSPATLPICNDLKNRMVLDDLAPTPGYHGNSHRSSPALVPQFRLPAHLPPPTPSLHTLAVPRMNLIKAPASPKPPLHPNKTRGSSMQRACPEGQSFRASIEEKPSRSPSPRNQPDSDEDYENVQLPDSVFVDTTETGSVERMFKENCGFPSDGLYCIRNSGTKTSKVLVVWDVSLNKARNYRVFEEMSRVFLETDMTFPSLAALVEHYYIHPLPNHGSLCLQQPYGYTVPR